MTKEERIKELAEEHKKKDNEISESIGLSFDSFKDEYWHAVRMECREDVALKAMSFMISQLSEYIAHKLTSEGRYDLLFCLRKYSGIENSEEANKAMQAIEAKRTELREHFKAEVMKIEAECAEEENEGAH